MSKITQQVIFVTSDGTKFETMKEAEDHQTLSNLKRAFKDYQDGRPGGMSLSGFFDFLDIHKELVREYLKEED